MNAARLVTLICLGASLTGCGAGPRNLATPMLNARAAAQGATIASPLKDDSDHAQMNAIVKSVLDGMFDELAKTADANKDGVISKDEFAKGRSAAAVSLFVGTFDDNHDGKVAAPEYAKAMSTDVPVEAFHKFTEEAMEKAITPYMKDKNFDSSKLRTYMTKDLGMTADWPQLFGLMDKLDLNKDGKVLSAKGEGPAFLLTFARPQMQRALGLAVTPLN